MSLHYRHLAGGGDDFDTASLANAPSTVGWLGIARSYLTVGVLGIVLAIAAGAAVFG